MYRFYALHEIELSLEFAKVRWGNCSKISLLLADDYGYIFNSDNFLFGLSAAGSFFAFFSGLL
jgi:hypothetical protein